MENHTNTKEAEMSFVFSTELYEFMEAMDYLLSKEFLDKWRYKYSCSFITFFQEKVLEALIKRKPIKKETLKNILKTKTKFNEHMIVQFYDDIDITLYYPMIL